MSIPATVSIWARSRPVAQRLEQGQVPADLDLQVFVRQRRAAPDDAGDGLRVLEVEEPGLWQRVDGHHLAALVLAFLQRRQHPGVVGARVLPHHKNQLGIVDVIQRHCALADPDGGVQR
jgi:hypothetical protein